MISHNFEGVLQAFDDEFANFLDPAYLSYATTLVQNTYYDFGFNHFFPLEGLPDNEPINIAGIVRTNYLDYLPSIQAAQGIRIDRLNKLLSSNEMVVFVRTHNDL